MPLVDQPFADTFTFSRARTAPCRDAAGVVQTLAIDAPRFDHTVAGVARGLLVEGRPQFGEADLLAVIDGDWADKVGTVLHEYETLSGDVIRRAWYAPKDPVSAVNACLNVKARHRRIAFLPVLMPNRGGWVRWGDQRWDLGGLIAAGGGAVVASTENLILLEG